MELEILVVEPSKLDGGLLFVGVCYSSSSRVPQGVHVEAETELAAAARVLYQQDTSLTNKEIFAYAKTPFSGARTMGDLIRLLMGHME